MEPGRLIQWLAGKSATQLAEWVVFNVTLGTFLLSTVRLVLRRTVPASMRDRVARALPWLNRVLDVAESLGASVIQFASALRRPAAPTPVVHPSDSGNSGR